ncbi:hypothetical protein [Aquimarina algiphila]|nr:hypothetical protein [Aquimarina algiphila]
MLENLLKLENIQVLEKNQLQTITGSAGMGCNDPDVGGGCHTSK